jgi:hypothetical protein
VLYKKGYQKSCDVESSVVTKVKGVVNTSYSDSELAVPNYPKLYQRIWDSIDNVIPTSGLEHGGFSVTTNVVITPNQTRGTCPEVLQYFQLKILHGSKGNSMEVILIGSLRALYALNTIIYVCKTMYYIFIYNICGFYVMEFL